MDDIGRGLFDRPGDNGHVPEHANLVFGRRKGNQPGAGLRCRVSEQRDSVPGREQIVDEGGDDALDPPVVSWWNGDFRSRDDQDVNAATSRAEQMTVRTFSGFRPVSPREGGAGPRS